MIRRGEPETIRKQRKTLPCPLKRGVGPSGPSTSSNIAQRSRIRRFGADSPDSSSGRNYNHEKANRPSKSGSTARSSEPTSKRDSATTATRCSTLPAQLRIIAFRPRLEWRRISDSNRISSPTQQPHSIPLAMIEHYTARTKYTPSPRPISMTNSQRSRKRTVYVHCSNRRNTAILDWKRSHEKLSSTRS
jgi:hypothetical protein